MSDFKKINYIPVMRFAEQGTELPIVISIIPPVSGDRYHVISENANPEKPYVQLTAHEIKVIWGIDITKY